MTQDGGLQEELVISQVITRPRCLRDLLCSFFDIDRSVDPFHDSIGCKYKDGMEGTDPPPRMQVCKRTRNFSG